MPGPSNTLLIEGTFEELADELSHYLDEVKKKEGDTSTAIQTEIAQLLEQNQKDEVLKKLVTGSAALNSAPEKGAKCERLAHMAGQCLMLVYRNHRSLQSSSPPCPPIPQP